MVCGLADDFPLKNIARLLSTKERRVFFFKRMAWIHLRTNDINHQMLSSQKEVADQMINNSLQREGFIFHTD